MVNSISELAGCICTEGRRKKRARDEGDHSRTLDSCQEENTRGCQPILLFMVIQLHHQQFQAYIDYLLCRSLWNYAYRITNEELGNKIASQVLKDKVIRDFLNKDLAEEFEMINKFYKMLFVGLAVAGGTVVYVATHTKK